MPLPFKLKYGKVGRIFVDIPMTGLFFSYPIKIELSEIFVLVEPKPVAEWKEDVIKESFFKATQSSLEDLEEYFKTRIAAQGSDSAIVNGIINRVVESLEIEVKNVYLRFEDTISNPNMTYAIGASIESIQLYSCNYRWLKEAASGGDFSYKTAKVSNLQVYLNYSDKKTRNPEEIRFEKLTEELDIDDVSDEEIKNIILTRNETGKPPSSKIVRNKKFMLEEIKGRGNYRYLIENFWIEARIMFNKNAKGNKDPKINVSVVIGGKFLENGKFSMDDVEGTGLLKLQKQQMTCILKFLDFSSNYTKFQAGVLKKILENKFDEAEANRYIEIYEEWRKNVSKEEVAKKIKEELGK